MTDLFREPADGTDLQPDEREGLLQSWITHRSDLNLAEEENIVAGSAWARSRRGRNPNDVLSADFALLLHKRMFGEVWNWAGTYRRTGRNIGVEAYPIQIEMVAMFDDVRYWLEKNTYPPDETAVRLHHRLVFIHPFPNGNGRHARLMADLLIERLGRRPFSWGGGALVGVGELRSRYVAALRAADGHDIKPLLAFARS
jgi:Fic-DOC domain mobile mystery protein B